MAKMKLTAAGDAMVFRRLAGGYEGFEEVQRFIQRGDFRCLNLETTVHRFETYAAAVSGGSWFCTPPESLEDMKAFGFNTLLTATNHSMDYSHEGLRLTLDYIQKSGLIGAGTGMTMGEACAPKYLDTPSGRYALIGACSSFEPDAMAGEQTRTMIGRPGLNGIRNKVVYELPREQMQQLESIADGIAINANYDLERAQGYLPPVPEGEARFGTLNFKEAEHAAKHSYVNEDDMQRTERSIREAKFFSDYVVVAIHSHQMRIRDKVAPAEFLEEFAHRCIDAGANAIVGTGPHMLRPIEIYKGCPIFYSLGDFIIQLETIGNAPADMYHKQKLNGNEGMDVLFDARSQGSKVGLYFQKVMFESVIPYWECENGVLTKLELMPIELNFGKPRSQGGWPRPEYKGGIIERLAKMSEAYGTKIRIDENGIGIVDL